MRIAILADIHGNLPALEAVLDDAVAAGVDLVIANGDLADGPFPGETLDRLLALGDRLLALRGNSDRWLVEAAGQRYAARDAATDALVHWANGRLRPAHRDMLARLPLTRTIDHPHLGRVGFCHATARADDEMIVVDSSLSRLRRCLAPLDAPTIFLGHTHMPFDRLVAGRRVVNCGSVGMPYGHRGAAWALIDDAITLRRTAYDPAAAAARILASGMPEAASFVRDHLAAPAGDAEALAAWHAIEAAQDAAERRAHPARLDNGDPAAPESSIR